MYFCTLGPCGSSGAPGLPVTASPGPLGDRGCLGSPGVSGPGGLPGREGACLPGPKGDHGRPGTPGSQGEEGLLEGLRVLHTLF